MVQASDLSLCFLDLVTGLSVSGFGWCWAALAKLDTFFFFRLSLSSPQTVAVQTHPLRVYFSFFVWTFWCHLLRPDMPRRYIILVKAKYYIGFSVAHNHDVMKLKVVLWNFATVPVWRAVRHRSIYAFWRRLCDLTKCREHLYKSKSIIISIDKRIIIL